MRNIVRLLYKLHALFLFLALQAICLTLFFQFNQYQQSSFIRSSGDVVGWFQDVRYSITEPFTVKEANEKLAAENAALRDRLRESWYVRDTRVLQSDTSVYEQQFEYLAARVINITTNQNHNYLTIDKGAAAGIEKDMGVVGNEGIVGFVLETSERYSVIVPVINDMFTTSVKLERTNDFGVLRWDDTDPNMAHVYGISASVKLNEGDTIVTKGASARYAEGMMVGTITDYELEPGRSDYTIDVELATNFNRLFHVYCIRNQFAEEQLELEENARME